MLFRGSFGVIIFVIGATVGITFAVVRYQVLDAYLPTELAEALDRARAGIGAESAGVSPGPKRVVAAASQDGPGQYLIDGPEGLVATGPIAAMAGNRPVLIEDVIDGYMTTVGSDIPAEITTIRPISGCRLTPPMEGAVVGHATSGETSLALPILTYNDSDLADAVQAFVNGYRQTGSTEVARSSALAYDVHDVAITETRGPVYLVLESSARNRLWNLHIAPDVRIERVVLLGGRHSGVANLDPVVPVEVLPGDALAACGIEPAYPLNRGHQLLALIASGTTAERQDAEARLAEVQEQVVAYNTWFRDSFGVLADATRAGFAGSTVSLIGPQPGEAEAKAAYAPIQGARLRMTRDTYFEIQGQAPAGEDFAGRVRAIATAFAFGDLANLRQGVQY